MTAASGADREHAKIPGSENSENAYRGECWCQSRGDAWPCRSASGADQPTLRDQLVATLVRNGVWPLAVAERCADALLPHMERAKAEGGAAAVHAVAEAIDTDPYIAHLVRRNAAGTAVDAAVILASSRAAALRGSTGGAG